MSQLPAVADVLDEMVALNGWAPRHNGFHLQQQLIGGGAGEDVGGGVG